MRSGWEGMPQMGPFHTDPGNFPNGLQNCAGSSVFGVVTENESPALYCRRVRARLCGWCASRISSTAA